jgi:glutathione synthase/RimK-type ligase-like ATP-grasp enzyme
VTCSHLRIVLLCHYGRTGYNILRALGSIGAEVFAVIDQRSASLRYSTRCKVIHFADRIDLADPETVVNRINDLHKARYIDCVMASDVESLTLLANIKDDLVPATFPMADLPVILLLNDKWEFCKLSRKTGVEIPNTIFFPEKCAIDPCQIATEIGFPAVLKPSQGYGQRGIVHFFSRDDVEAYLREAPDNGGVVVQEFVEGPDWAISVFAMEGKIALWTAWECPGQLEKSYGVGRFLTTEFQTRTDLLEMAAALISETNFSGVANFDARLDVKTNSMKLFECNPRFFGRLSAARLCGLDFVKIGLPFENSQPLSMLHGFYYPWQELFTARGWRNLRSGRWNKDHLFRDVYEMLRDPMPPVVRKLISEDSLA